MATWSGWQRQLLQAAKLPTGSVNMGFLSDWANYADRPGCTRNPVDISHHAAGSTDCGAIGSGRVSQRFTSHATAAAAFAAQLTPADYSHLHQALASSNPYGTANAAGVALDLQKWGSTKFQAHYITETGIGSGFGSGGGDTAGFHKGWHDLRRSVNTNLPAALHSSDRTVAAALRSLSRARRVRI